MHQPACLTGGTPLRALALSFAALLAAPAAHAALGSTTTLSTPGTNVLNGAAIERTYVDAGGSTIHEYTSSTGAVFAYTWQGPSVPDLRALLGSYYASYQQASTQAQASTPSLHSQHLEPGDVSVETGGMMRAYVGRTWLRSALPAGVSASDLQ